MLLALSYLTIILPRQLAGGCMSLVRLAILMCEVQLLTTNHNEYKILLDIQDRSVWRKHVYLPESFLKCLVL